MTKTANHPYPLEGGHVQTRKPLTTQRRDLLNDLRSEKLASERQFCAVAESRPREKPARANFSRFSRNDDAPKSPMEKTRSCSDPAALHDLA
jgi:hypothetical protein